MRRTSVAWVGSQEAPGGKPRTSTRVPQTRSPRP
jgi:hypothetical protein